ncbi:VOC family protein [Aeromonas allosaccharophila]|uniref:VOC family protein n=1 Tax=Aeromonas allosaccharophila TaxID=656 RepID=UPI001BD15C36|nr:VOC family protein [Aeromonas allosaccharophila]MBS4696163.1 VOC family protein [Aeromonas allosaccharophila]
MVNIGMHFEIPVADMQRAIAFYSAVFDIEFERVQIDGNEMALFPLIDGAEGCSGALARGESYVPSLDGTRIYLTVNDIERVMADALSAGARLLYPVTRVGEAITVAEFQDSEGNRIALLDKAICAD